MRFNKGPKGFIMLCLPKPYGAPFGISISIIAPNYKHKVIAYLSEQYGCPPFICKKVDACILHSGRYDCFVGMFPSSLLMFEEDILRAGGQVIVNPTGSYSYYDYKRLREDRRFHIRRESVLGGPPVLPSLIQPTYHYLEETAIDLVSPDENIEFVKIEASI
jgi:hypothetical protein